MTSGTLPKANNTDLVIASAVFLLFCYLFYSPLKEIALICWTKDDYSHGLLLPIVAVYMIWDRRFQIRDRLAAAHSKTAESHFAKKENGILLPELLVLFGLFVYFLGVASGISFTSWLGFFPTALGLVHLVLGRTAMYCFAPPILLLYMAKPLPDSLVVRVFWPLQVFAAKVSAKVLEWLDVPVFLSGNIIEIPEMRLMVEEACSGMRSVMALLTLAFIVNYFIDLSRFSKFLLVLASLLVAIVLNVVRVAMTGVLAHFYDPQAATGFFHTFSGLIVFLVGLPVLYGLGNLLLRLEGKSIEPAAVGSKQTSAKDSDKGPTK